MEPNGQILKYFYVFWLMDQSTKKSYIYQVKLIGTNYLISFAGLELVPGTFFAEYLKIARFTKNDFLQKLFNAH